MSGSSFNRAGSSSGSYQGTLCPSLTLLYHCGNTCVSMCHYCEGWWCQVLQHQVAYQFHPTAAFPIANQQKEWLLTQLVMQACTWTSDCTVPGCTDQCIANSENLGFSLELSDFEFSESSYRMCPVVATFVSRFLTIEGFGPDPGAATSSGSPSGNAPTPATSSVGGDESAGPVASPVASLSFSLSNQDSGASLGALGNVVCSPLSVQ